MPEVPHNERTNYQWEVTVVWNRVRLTILAHFEWSGRSKGKALPTGT